MRLLPLLLAAALAAGQAQAAPAYLIDTHVHIDPPVGVYNGVPAAIASMDRFGIRQIVLMSPPQPRLRENSYDFDALRFAREKYPGRIFPAAGGTTLNAMIHQTPPAAVTDAVMQKFRAEASRLAAQGAAAFGEIAVHHLSMAGMGPNHPYEATAADHPLLLLLADIAAESGVPIDLHIDLVPQDMTLPPRPIYNPANPAQLTENLSGFERLLDHNPNAKIVWAHAGTDPLGTRTPAVQRALLTRHKNLSMSLRPARGGPPPMLALDESRQLKPEWRALIAEFPDRFVLGSDYFHGAGGRGVDEAEFENFWRLVCALPDPVAEAVAHGNAERLYRLPAAAPAGAAFDGCALAARPAQERSGRPGPPPAATRPGPGMGRH